MLERELHDPLAPCRRCIGAIFCRNRKVDLAVKDILLARTIRPDNDYESPALWEHGRWTTDPSKTPLHLRRWRRWREHCFCCGKTYLALWGGCIKIRVHPRCQFSKVPRNLCDRCRKFIKNELGDNALLGYRQLRAAIATTVDRDVNARWDAYYREYEEHEKGVGVNAGDAAKLPGETAGD